MNDAVRRLHCLRIRQDDNSEWGPVGYYRSKRLRDKSAAMNRILAGIRTHSWQESKSEAEKRIADGWDDSELEG